MPPPPLTLCCVDCQQPRLAAMALERSAQKLGGAAALLLTDSPDAAQGCAVEVRAIEAIRSKEAYSRFMLKELHRHITTPHVLVVQWDGFVADAAAWTDEFLDYDYLGAPWWYQDGFNVGNGGFSLRSQRLLAASRDDFVRTDIPEDAAIGRVFRRHLELAHGIRIAPEPLAARFAYERTEPAGPTFGFHGAFNLWRHLDDDELTRWWEALHPAALAYSEMQELAVRLAQQGRFVSARRLCRLILARHPQQQAGADLLLKIAGRPDERPKS